MNWKAATLGRGLLAVQASKMPGACCCAAARFGGKRGIGFYPLYPCSVFLFARTVLDGFGKAAIDVPRRRRLFAGIEGIKGIKAAAAE